MYKLIIATAITALLLNPVEAEAKTFYGKMKENLASGNRPDLEKHYRRSRTCGQVIRFIPNVWYAQDVALGLFMIGGFGKELIDIPMPNHKFDMQDFAADWKGVRDGVNGKDFIHDELILRAIRESNDSIIDQKEVLTLLQKRVELLEQKL